MLRRMTRDMDVTIIHNPTAGDGTPTRDQLTAALHAAGCRTTYRSTKTDGYLSALQEPGDAVLVAGGDGTIRRVALELRGRHVPVAILPSGTANNFATSIGIAGGLEDSVHRVLGGRLHGVDMGHADGGWDDPYFLEGAGFGVVPELIRMMDRYAHEHPDLVGREEELQHARELLERITALLPAFDCSIETDEGTRHVRPILLQIMNGQRIGPSLPVAPAASVQDGSLDVVWVEEEDRDRLRDAFSGWCNNDTPGIVTSGIRAAAVRIACDAPLSHLDDRVRRTKKRNRAGYEIEFRCEPGVLQLLL
jgi:diacylglycerol kinase (ATP)